MRWDNVLWGFLAGAVAVSAVTLTADRYGSRIGGTLGGIPFTLAASLFFMARTNGPSAAVEAAGAIPVLMTCYGACLAAYCYLVRGGLWRAVLYSTLLWGCLVSLSIRLQNAYGMVSAVGIYVTALAISFYLLEVKWALPPSKGAPIRLRPREVALRMLCGGSIVAGAVVVAALLGPVAGAAVAAFPAVTLASVVVAYRAGGRERSAALGKSLLLSGMLSSGVYAMCVRLAYPGAGALLGTVLAASVTAGAVWLLLRITSSDTAPA